MNNINGLQMMETPLSEELSEIISNSEMGSKIIEYFNEMDKKQQPIEKEIKIKLDRNTTLILEPIGKAFSR